MSALTTRKLISRSDCQVEPRDAAGGVTAPTAPSLEDLYREFFPFVWRSARRLGVASSLLDDVVQDVFMVVHRQLPEYEPRSAARAWIFSITRRVAADSRRAMRRREGTLPLHEAVASRACDDPLRDTLNKERSALVVDFLGSLNDLHREVFILCELEQMTAPEIAEAVGAGTAAVYSRIRTARQAFVAYVQARHPELMGGSNG